MVTDEDLVLLTIRTTRHNHLLVVTTVHSKWDPNLTLELLLQDVDLSNTR